MSQPHPSLTALIDSLHQAGRGRETVALGHLLQALGARGFGPLLMVLALLVISPVGMVPGVPAITGAALAVVGGHMVIGRRQLRLPARLARVKLSGALITGAAAQLRRLLDLLHPVLGRRKPSLSETGPAVALIGLAAIITGLVIALIGFIPGLPFTLALHLLAFGLGLTLRDGLLVALGWLLLAPELALLIWLWP